jgi:hypothetical protein
MRDISPAPPAFRYLRSALRRCRPRFLIAETLRSLLGPLLMPSSQSRRISSIATERQQRFSATGIGPVPASGERRLNGNPLSNSCLSPHPLGGTGGGIHSTSHTSERSTAGHCATTRLRVLARSSSGVRASFLSIIESLSRSCMHPGERTRCSCSASDSSRCLCLGFALHDPATIVFRRAISARRSASAKY